MLLNKQESGSYRAGKDTLIKKSRIGKGAIIDDDSIVLSSVIGDHCEIEKRNLIQSAEIGDMTYTGQETSIMWAKVGKYCNISRLVDIGGNEHNYRAASMMPDYRLRNKLKGAITKHPDEPLITVGNDVWIGQGVSILRKEDLVVGDGAVLGSGCVVTKDIPPYAIAVGIPAKVIGYRFPEEMIAELLRLRWWDWSEERILDSWELLSQDLTPEILAELCERAAKWETEDAAAAAAADKSAEE